MPVRFSIGKEDRKKIKEYLSKEFNVKITDKNIDDFCRKQEENMLQHIIEDMKSRGTYHEDVKSEELEADVINDAIHGLTELEIDVIKHGFGNNEYGDGDGCAVWSWSIQPNCKIVTKEQISGVIGSLVKKELAGADKAGNDSTTWLTDEGKAVLMKLKGEN